MEETPSPEKKIVLPSSGLAEEILAGIEAGPGQGDGAEGEASGAVRDASSCEGEDNPAEAAPAPEAVEDAFSLEEDGEEKKEEEESLHLVSFFLSTEEYALDISQVQEIIRAGEWTRVPNAPRHIKGVINLRGRIIPVVDLKVRMDLREAEMTKNSRIMVINTDGRVLGILVDGVSQVLRLPTRVVEPPPEEVSEADKGYIKGVGKLDGRLIILLELAKVIGREEKAVLTA